MRLNSVCAPSLFLISDKTCADRSEIFAINY
jgi:hypothetical protein